MIFRCTTLLPTLALLEWRHPPFAPLATILDHRMCGRRSWPEHRVKRTWQQSILVLACVLVGRVAPWPCWDGSCNAVVAGKTPEPRHYACLSLCVAQPNRSWSDVSSFDVAPSVQGSNSAGTDGRCQAQPCRPSDRGYHVSLKGRQELAPIASHFRCIEPVTTSLPLSNLSTPD